MSRPVQAALYIDTFTDTGVPGEYTFVNASYNNQSDATGNGAYDAAIGSALYVPATDANSSQQVPGCVHRYKLTALSVVDGQTLSGTVIWDEPGPQVDVPTNGTYVLYAEVASDGYGSPPSDLVYNFLPPGSTTAALEIDLRDITNQLAIPVQLTGVTTDAIPTKLVNGSGVNFVSLLEALYVFTISVQGINADNSGNDCAFTLQGAIKRTATATALVGGVLKSILLRSDPAWDVEVLADTVSNGICVLVTGSAGVTLNWTSSVDFTKSS